MRRIVSGLAVLALLLGSARQTRADIIISNLPSSDSHGFGFAGGDGLGEEFRMGNTSYALDSVVVVLASSDPADVRLQVGLYGTSSTGRPGTLLDTFSTPTLATGLGVPYTLTPTSPFTLEANTSYWLVINALPGSSIVEAFGSLPPVTPTGPGATYVDQAFGSGNPPTGPGTGEPSSFQVNGTPAAVPAPSSLTLLGLGMLALLGYNWRRRRAVAAVTHLSFASGRRLFAVADQGSCWRRHMYNHRAYLFLLAVGGALILPSLARADIMQLTNPDQFTSQATLLTFEGVQPFQNVTSYDGAGFQYVGQHQGSGLQGAFDQNYLREFSSQEPAFQEGTFLNQYEFGTQGVQITFPSAINLLAFELRTFPNETGDLSIELLSSGIPIDSFTLPNRGTTDTLAGEFLFYGFESSTPFDSVILQGPGDGRFGLDNVEFENGLTIVPGPSTLSLLGLGTLTLLGYGWWRGRAVAAAC